jgi:CheY-like chemotaxis protein
MKADSASHGHEEDAAESEASARRQDHLSQDLRPQLNAIIEFAERLKMNSESDENVQQILITARGLLDVISRESAKSRAGNSAARSASNERYDVLYIEDDSLAFTSVKLLLGNQRALKVLQATNGRTGVALAQTRHPKLILLDLTLPDIHGSEVISRLQKNPATSPIPVVVMSADATPSQIERLLVLGARNYLTKPFEVEPFLAVVDEILEENTAVRITS